MSFSRAPTSRAADTTATAPSPSKRRQTMAGYASAYAKRGGGLLSGRSGSPLSRIKSAEQEAPAAARASSWSIKSAATHPATQPFPSPKSPKATLQPATPAACAPEERCTVRLICTLAGGVRLRIQTPPAPASPCNALVPINHCTALIPYQSPASVLLSKGKPARSSAAAPAAFISLDLELSPEEVQWIVQVPDLAEDIATCMPTTKPSARALLSSAAAKMRTLPRRLMASAAAGVSRLHARLALGSLSCLSQPAVAE